MLRVNIDIYKSIVYIRAIKQTTMQWRDNEPDGVPNHRRLNCLLNRLSRRSSKKISKLRVTSLCEVNQPVTGGFHHKGYNKLTIRGDVTWASKHPILLIFRLFCQSLIRQTATILIPGSLCAKPTSDITHSPQWHYNDVIMSAMASQITSLAIVYSTVHSGVDQRKHQSSASLAFMWGIHRWPVNSPHKRPATRKMYPFDDVIMHGDSILMSWFTRRSTRSFVSSCHLQVLKQTYWKFPENINKEMKIIYEKVKLAWWWFDTHTRQNIGRVNVNACDVSRQNAIILLRFCVICHCFSLIMRLSQWQYSSNGTHFLP